MPSLAPKIVHIAFKKDLDSIKLWDLNFKSKSGFSKALKSDNSDLSMDFKSAIGRCGQVHLGSPIPIQGHESNSGTGLTGANGIPTSDLRLAAPIIVLLIAHMMALSFSIALMPWVSRLQPWPPNHKGKGEPVGSHPHTDHWPFSLPCPRYWKECSFYSFHLTRKTSYQVLIWILSSP